MKFSCQFVSATKEYNEFRKFVPAPYLRKNFLLEKIPQRAEITLCGLGFYRLFVNGTELTKGHIAPYISNPDHMLPYDNYDILPFLREGNNTVGFLLGNGMQNAAGGMVWAFDKAPWRSAPKVAFCIELQNDDGTAAKLVADSSVKTHPSPILMDDLRIGEFYDAREEIFNWCSPDYDDSRWNNALLAETPRGDAVLCTAEPIKIRQELGPVKITKGKADASYTPHRTYTLSVSLPEDELQTEGYLYDFGLNSAGVCRLKIKGSRGQKIILQFAEHLKDNGEVCLSNISYYPYGLHHRVVYILKGEDEEIYVPSFTYFGFRYCLVMGITEEQAAEELLTYLVMSSDLKQIGAFSCSDEVANQLYEMTLRSDLANFYYFPTDCPHREKNGWTGDAAVSAEQLLMSLTPEKSFSQWLFSIRKAQDILGRLPGVVPTAGWGFAWGNGPAWDAVLVYLPYFTWLYRGDTSIIMENAASILRYLSYLFSRKNRNGLIEIGLGDWVPAGKTNSPFAAPLEFTDSVISMDIARKAAELFRAAGLTPHQAFAESIAGELRENIRRHLLDLSSMTAIGNCQTSQAMALFYDVFDPGERPAAFSVLLRQIENKNGHFDTGMLGLRVIFRVLSDFGYSDLAYHMITRPEFPSYGNWIERGATSLWEDFRSDAIPPSSKNHHFLGDISAWFISCVAGIRINPHKRDYKEVHIAPSFIEKLNFARAHHILPCGKVSVSWQRTENGSVSLEVQAPQECYGRILPPRNFKFEDGTSTAGLKSGTYLLIPYRRKDSITD